MTTKQRDRIVLSEWRRIGRPLVADAAMEAMAITIEHGTVRRIPRTTPRLDQRVPTVSATAGEGKRK